MSRLLALAWKDLLVNGRMSLLLVLGMPIWIRLMLLLRPPQADVTRPYAIPVAVFSMILVPGLATTLANWLVEKERSRETFAWLRTLPLSDWHIVGSKFLVLLTFYLLAGAIWWLLLGSIGPALSARQFATMWMLFFVVGSLALTSSIALTGRSAAGAPMLLWFLALLAAKPTADSPARLAKVVELWNTPSSHPWAWLLGLMIEAALVALAYLVFHRRDSHQLVD